MQLYKLQFGTLNDWYHTPYHAPSAHSSHKKKRPDQTGQRKKSSSKHLEMGRVKRHNHEQTGNKTSTWQGDDPSREDEANLLPVDGL